MMRYHLAACVLALSTLTFPVHAAQREPLKMRWEVLRNELAQPRSRTKARISITALKGKALPAQGWSLYFNTAYGIVTGQLDGQLTMEKVSGGLYRVRPAAGFKGLNAGRTLHVDYYFSGLLIKMERAPAGPYLVYDAEPDVAHVIGDYQMLLPTRSAQLQRPAGEHELVTPQQTYRNNAGADVLPAAALPLVFPTPLALKPGAGRVHLARAPQVISGPGLKYETALARALFARYLPQGDASRTPVPLRLRIGVVDGQRSPEAYELSISADDGISITGNSAAGVARGLQSLHDLLPLPTPGEAQFDLPELSVTDAPRFAYRGFQLDVARNFQPKEVVMKTLDLMATYKLNKLHFHLTDDEGWRLEIGGLPELTSIGAVRGHSALEGVRLPPAYGSGPRINDPHGSGYYTRADYIEILRYAAARHIEVIPEVEMPGHARAAVKSMEARYHHMTAAGDKDAAQFLLTDFDDRSVYRSPQQYNDHVINAGLESSYAFIDHVVGQIAAMHREAGVPLTTMHVGGDELPLGAWERSPASQALMRREQLASIADLWDYFYDRVDGILRKHGVTASGWEELGARRTAKEDAPLSVNPRFAQRGFSLYVWNNTPGNEDFAYRAANAGYDIVLAPVTNMYLDMATNANPEEPGVNWGGYVELETVYNFQPMSAQLTEAGRKRIRGVEATLFSETVRTTSQLDYLMMPRLLAVAERAWAPDPDWAQAGDAARAAALRRAAWSGFVNVLGQRVLPRLDLERGDVAYRIAPPGMVVEGGKVLVNHVLPGLTLRYTTDGSAPTARSKPVTGLIAAKGTISAAAFDRTGRAGMVARIINR
ncbi:family 20 glycosylhydrolase [Duganella sp. FT50W]|uniref:beta-N-acetylhexosaminidase n=1 Tax=Duganella lactea TaxID=2692173 RepID=A0A6L8MGQ7_9BURK|nr:family 20 glycosylhydrolase [Duganella lactea]MYM81579.1 family 20 glycosylhydrolase [Duganella lactea]